MFHDLGGISLILPYVIFLGFEVPLHSLFIGLSSSQPIGCTGLKYALFNEDLPVVFLRKFGEDQGKTLSVGLFFPKKKIPNCSRNSMPD